jgi:Phage capsid family
MPESNILAEKRQEYAAKTKKFAEVGALVTSPDDYSKKEVLEALGAKDASDAKDKMRAASAETEALARDIDSLELEDMKSRNGDAVRRAEDWRKRRDNRPTPSASDESKSFGGLITGSKSWAGSSMQPGTKIDVDMGDEGMKTLLQTSAGWQPRTGNGSILVDKIIRPVQVLDVFPADRTDLFEIPSMEETTRTQAAAELAEAGTYAEDAFVFTRRSSPIRKIGSEIPVTDEQLDDVPGMQALLNNRLSFGVRARLDQQVMVGDGTGSNLTGLVNATNVQTQAKAADSNLIALYKALVLVRISGRASPTTFFVHGQDWQNIRLAQNGYGEFFMGPPAQVGENTLWGLPVVQTEALTQGTAVCASVDPQWMSIWYRKDLEVQVGFINDQFIKGQKTVRADIRAGLWIGRGQAICKVTGL